MSVSRLTDWQRRQVTVAIGDALREAGLPRNTVEFATTRHEARVMQGAQLVDQEVLVLRSQHPESSAHEDQRIY